MKWEEDEIDFMRVALEEGWTHKDIANELSRTSIAIKTKASRLALISKNNQKKTTEDYKKQLPEDIIVLEVYINKNTKILHEHSCGFIWDVAPTNVLAGHNCPNCAGNAKKTTAEYIKQMPDNIILLDEYINTHTRIKHKHSCGFIWNTSPHSILEGKGCPSCAAGGFKDDISAVTYCVYFPEYDLYKFGISNNFLQRFKQFGSIPEIIFIREFKLGLEARELEKEWSQNVDHLKVNTGLLKSGNTETFRI